MNKNFDKNSYSFRLGVIPSFLTGMGSILAFNLKNTRFNYSSSDDEADFYALSGDWKEIGNDVSRGISEWKTIVRNQI